MPIDTWTISSRDALFGESRNDRKRMIFLALGGEYYPVVNGFQVFCGIRQSMPSRGIESCDADIDTLPSFAAGHTKRPRSRRLENRHAPCWSHQMIFSRSPRRPRNTNRWPEYGSSSSVLSACAASVLNPRRMSVTPAASQTHVLLGTGIKTSAPSKAGPAHQGQTRPRL